MTIQDIVVGQKYIHSRYPGCVWLGVGKRKMWEDKFTATESNYHFKHLVLIEDLFDGSKYIGQVAQEGDDALDGYWDGFVKA